MKRTTAWTIALAGVLVLGGCSGSSDPWREPDAAMLKVAQDLSAGHPEVAWEALPPSYREDIESLLHTAAAKMDPEVWSASFQTLDKLGRVLSEKREFILANPMLASQREQLPKIEMALDGTAALIATFSRSSLADLEQLGQLDVEEFLATTGAELLSNLRELPAAEDTESWAASLEDLAQTKVTVVSREGDRATLRIEVPDEEPREETWLRVEQRWVPEEVATSWKDEIGKIRERLENAGTALSPEQKQAVLMQLGMVDGVLDRLLATQTAEEFNQQVSGILGLVMGAMMSRSAPS